MVRNRLSVAIALIVAAALSAPAAGAQPDASWRVDPVLELPVPATLHDVAASGRGDVWAVGVSSSRPLVVRWAGKSWAEVEAPDAEELMAVDVAPSGEVWVAGSQLGQPLLAHRDGATWQAVPVPDAGEGILAGIDMLTEGDGWAVGTATLAGRTEPLILHGMAGLWQRVQPPPMAGPAELSSVYAAGSDEVWAAGTQWNAHGAPSPLLLHWNGFGWEQASLPRPGPGLEYHLAAVAGEGDQVWAVGESCAVAGERACQALVLHRDGQSWQVVATAGNIGTELSDVVVFSALDVWVVGYDMATGKKIEHIEHWDGSAFTMVRLRPMLPRDFPAAGLSALARVPGTGMLWAVGWLEEPTSGRSFVLRYQ